jgi:hypothetical protein
LITSIEILIELGNNGNTWLISYGYWWRGSLLCAEDQTHNQPRVELTKRINKFANDASAKKKAGKTANGTYWKA